MKALLATVLLFAATVMAQQQQPHPPYQPPQDQPRSVSPNQPPEQSPPDMQAPAQPTLSNAEVQHQIDSKIADQPELAASNIKVNVDDHSVSLTGTVDSQEQHDLVLRIAQSYAGDRPIDDKIAIRGHA